MSAVPAVDAVALTAPVAPTVHPGYARRLLRRKIVVACVAYLAIVAGIAVVAPIVLPDTATERAGDLAHTLEGPSREHLLGTDQLGRDVLNRLLVGTRIAMIGVAEALAVVLLLAVPLGLVAGYYGGWIDNLVSRSADLAFALPGILVILVVLAVFPRSLLAGMVTFAILAAPGLMRVVRSAVLPVKEELYIAAARVSGVSHPAIVARHVLPRVSGPIIVQASLLAAAALLVQTGLSFLGLLAPAPQPSWGGMVADGLAVIIQQPWLIWPPGIAIALTIVALGLLGDAVRDVTAETWSASPQLKPQRVRTTRVAAEPAHATTAGTLLSIQGLTIGFPMANGEVRRVVEDVSFDIRAGETVGVVGESGCGKSVTAMSVVGLLPANGVVLDGAIVFDGRDLRRLSSRDRHRVRGKEIGLASQEPMASLNPAFRVGVQLAEVVRYHHHASRAEVRNRVLDLLRQVHLSDAEAVARRYPHELSGGMAQRISIARALAGEPKLLIADEPTTALDVTLQAEILELLRELQRERHMAVLLVTHDWGVISDMCERVVVMYAGQVVERAHLLPICRRPLHPYTEALLAASPHHASEAQPLPTIPGDVPEPGGWPSGCHFHPRCRYASDECRVGTIPLERATSTRETRCIHSDQLLANP
jgi:peptide/nickel transport system permease protein